MPGPGRQAEAARNDRRLLEAAREVFTTIGFDAPVAAVAERAGVGIASLYRRYASKEALLQHLCVVAMEQVIEAAEKGLRDPDPLRGLTAYIRDCVSFSSGALAPVADTIETTDEMWRTARKSRRLTDKVVARAQAAGVVRSDVTDVDISTLIELFSRRSPIRSLDQDQQTRDRLLAIAIEGLRPDPRDPLPGRPLTAREYAAPWGRAAERADPTD